MEPKLINDRCPYCLTYDGMKEAQAQGVRFCPLCAADWKTIGRPVDITSSSVILPRLVLPAALRQRAEEDDASEPEPEPAPKASPAAAPRPSENDFEEFPTSQYIRVVGGASGLHPAAHAPEAAAPPPEPTPWSTVALGLLIGLVLTLAVALLLERRTPPANAPTPTESPAPTATAPTPPAPTPAAPAPKPAPEPPARVVLSTGPVAPADAPTPATEAPATDTPPPIRGLEADRVMAAVLDAQSLLPPASTIDVRPRIAGPVVFLDGQVDGPETLKTITEAVAAVPGVLAVDTRGVMMTYRKHRMRTGDSLYKIAAKYYGDVDAWTIIWNANRDLIRNPNDVPVGLELRIPPKPTPRR